MSDKPQTYASHARYDPWFHFVLLPLLLIIFVGSLNGAIFVHHDLHFHILLALFSAVLIGVLVRMRTYSLKVQDRVVRLEERLRLSALLPEGLRARIPELTVRQLVALRFASDAEVPALVEKTLAESLSAADIKKLIQNWRADYFRV